MSSCDSRRVIRRSPRDWRNRGGTTIFLVHSSLRRVMAPFSIIPLRQREKEADWPHLELANSHTFIQLRQMCRSVQDGTDKHLFYIKRYTIPGWKIQASRFPVLSSTFHCDTKTTRVKCSRTTPNISGVERLHKQLGWMRLSHLKCCYFSLKLWCLV